ncbi:hypothetical protein EGR52_01480 [bacterium]|nr:hypothetical protein [bacterium]
MKDKKTLITIIVLLVIFLPCSIIGTIKHFDMKKGKIVDDNINKEFIYNNKLYFYDNDKLLSTYACNTCKKASNKYSDIKNTNYYKFGIKEIEPVLTNMFGIFEENGKTILYNLTGGNVLDSYDEVINYGISSTSKFLINKKDNKWGILFLDFSNNTITNEYDYIALPAHLNNKVLDSSKFIVSKNNLWYILKEDGTLFKEATSKEIVDFNEEYYITYDGSYHIMDYNNVEYLQFLSKKGVYAVGKYIFIESNNNLLLVYEKCDDSLRQQVVLPDHESIYFNVIDNAIEIILDQKLFQKLDLK